MSSPPRHFEWFVFPRIVIYWLPFPLLGGYRALSMRFCTRAVTWHPFQRKKYSFSSSKTRVHEPVSDDSCVRFERWRAGPIPSNDHKYNRTFDSLKALKSMARFGWAGLGSHMNHVSRFDLWKPQYGFRKLHFPVILGITLALYGRYEEKKKVCFVFV
jgi:hypothetical protein